MGHIAQSLTGTGHTVLIRSWTNGAPYLAFGTAVNALNACADAMALARVGEWDRFESALTRLDDAQLGVFIERYGDKQS